MESPRASQPETKRVAYFDTVRFWLILTVVVGHTLLELTDTSRLARQLYWALYLFHMPAFVLVTGYLARHFTWTPKSARRTVETLLVPYLLFEVSSQFINRHYEGGPVPHEFFVPQWLGWFLMAMMIWRVLTPLFQALRYPVATAVAISLLAPLVEVPAELALHKTLGLLPFYVVGLTLTQEHFEKLRTWPKRLGAAGLLASTFVAARFTPTSWDANWLKWKRSYSDLGVSIGEGIAVQGLLLALGFLLTASVLALVSWRDTVLALWGSRTLYAYLLHGYVLLFLTHEAKLFPVLSDWGTAGVVAAVVGALGVAIALMTAPVARVCRPLFAPNLHWLFRS